MLLWLTRAVYTFNITFVAAQKKDHTPQKTSCTENFSNVPLDNLADIQPDHIQMYSFVKLIKKTYKLDPREFGDAQNIHPQFIMSQQEMEQNQR